MSDEVKDTKAQVSRPEVWDTEAVARHLGVKVGTVADYMKRGTIPEPDGRLSGRWPWWYADTITTYERPGRGRKNPLAKDDEQQD